MKERLLSDEETKSIYKRIDELGLEPYDEDIDRKSSELYYELEGKKYRLIYTPNLDWFCDIAYEGDY